MIKPEAGHADRNCMAKDRPAKMLAPSTVLKPCAYGAVALLVIPAILKMALGG